MSAEQRRQRELEDRYHDLQREIERRGGFHGEVKDDTFPLELKVQFLESVLRVDDKLSRKR
jgi:hypothetical protein